MYRLSILDGSGVLYYCKCIQRGLSLCASVKVVESYGKNDGVEDI